MKSKKIIFALAIIVSIILVFIGFVWFAVSSIPLQDADMAPASAIAQQNFNIAAGIVMMIVGAVAFIGSIIWRKKKF